MLQRIVFRWTGNGIGRHHHGQEEDLVLDLPCDWRFLPKLGPLRLPARGLSF
ncbi:hypothetical protein [Acidisphaera rubrifaciens]|uniref:hypothetical protein n=1 Tax=Acidisphaera rubrifaciens TaxID=50715 RepID=UPI00130E6371|nr:hypothetical protein [Acidisphaera rubrifaciens]